MRGLFLSLPPFSPDYSGAASVLIDMNALIAVHDGTGCAGNFLGCDDPRGARSGHMVYTSNLREMEVVMGDDEALIEKVRRAAADLDPSMIVLLNTPAPLVIGTDFRALARIIEKQTGKPTLWFDTNGIRMYDWGVEKALLAAVKRFSADYAAECERGGIAVLGTVPEDIGAAENAYRLKECLERASGRKTTVVGMTDGEKSLGAAACAELNIVTSAAGIPAAEWCRQEFGIPWIADFPVGECGEKRLADRIAAVLDGCAAPEKAAAKAGGRRALVIHEQVMANAFRECLREEFGFGEVEVASFFAFREELAEDGDFTLTEELELEEKVTAGHYDVVFCDRLMHGMLQESGAELIDLPHLAVSSNLCYPAGFCPVGKAASAYLEEKLHGNQ